jgi:hypothetical protein
MNSGPIGVRTQRATMLSISAIAPASTFQLNTSWTGSSCAGCRAPQSAIVFGERSSTQRAARWITRLPNCSCARRSRADTGGGRTCSSGYQTLIRCSPERSNRPHGPASAAPELMAARWFWQGRNSRLLSLHSAPEESAAATAGRGDVGPAIKHPAYRDVKPSLSVCMNATIASSSTSFNPRWPN